MSGSSSSRHVNTVLSHPSWTTSRPSKRARTNRSIWNSTDDWDELVAASTLSTASVSSRPARPHGLQSLATCADIAASRHFKRLYEDGKERDASGVVKKGWWEVEWEVVPDHLRARVRDGVFKRYGSMLKLDIIKDLFIVPPDLILPGHLIPALSASTTLKPIHPSPIHLSKAEAPLITSLRLQHCPQVSDVAVAGLIYLLPNLEFINLKGCSMVGSRTVKTILERCPHLRGVNLKGTKVSEADLTLLLAQFGERLERFKVDDVAFKNPDRVFAAQWYPRITHLCLPGDIINAPAQSFRARAQRFGHTIAHPAPREARSGAYFDWPNFGKIFPAVTHLYLPGLLVPQWTVLPLGQDRIIKFSLGTGGPPVPSSLIRGLVERHNTTLRSLHIGHLLDYNGLSGKELYGWLGSALEDTVLEDFRFLCDPAGSKHSSSDSAMEQYAHLVYMPALRGPWRASLKQLHLALPQKIPSDAFTPSTPDVNTPALEHLSLASADLASSDELSTSLHAFRNLRTLDVSGTSMTTEQVFGILDNCQLLSRIDLTSCRGVGVRLRRGVFEAWKEDREAAEKRERGVEVEGEDRGAGRGRRTRQRRG